MRRDRRGDRDDRDQIHELREQHLERESRRAENRVDDGVAKRDRVGKPGPERQRALLATIACHAACVEQAKSEHNIRRDDDRSEGQQRRPVGRHDAVGKQHDDGREEVEVEVEDPLVPWRGRLWRSPLPRKADRERADPQEGDQHRSPPGVEPSPNQ